MKSEQKTNTTSNTEATIIERLRKVSSIEGRNVTDAGRIVALYIAGISEQNVKAHIKKKTFSGANALEHIPRPNTPAAREAWYRGKAICRVAGLPILRSKWEDRPNEDL
ncbi:hypothetical protein D4S03_07935 [bacterium]|nr:MAG: hypothetical protein D4S03_07935 [bacterium]